MNPADIIRKKRNGFNLSDEEINYFIKNSLNGEIPDYQLSAFLMAVYFKGLCKEEIRALTSAYINSGTRISLNHINKPKIDKHSTGGVGDKTSLILAPLVACFDVVVPMVSGRSLGHTGGTLDKLESIPGFNVNLGIKDFISILEKINVCMIGQTSELTPADRKIYAIRDVTATVENIGLIAASIASKKIAEGAEGVVYNVKKGCGSTIPPELSEELARELISISSEFGQKAVAVISDMNSPLGYAIGNWLEVRECIEIMNPSYRLSELSSDLLEVTLFLAGAMLYLAGKCGNIEEGINLAGTKLSDGSAFAKFMEMVEAQGGNLRFIQSPDIYPISDHEYEITAECHGYVTGLNAFLFGQAAVELRCGRKKADDIVSHNTGIILEKKCGSSVLKGDTVCRIFGDSDESVNNAAELIRQGIEISHEALNPSSRILNVIYQ